MQRGQIVVW